METITVTKTDSGLTFSCMGNVVGVNKSRRGGAVVWSADGSFYEREPTESFEAIAERLFRAMARAGFPKGAVERLARKKGARA